MCTRAHTHLRAHTHTHTQTHTRLHLHTPTHISSDMTGLTTTNKRIGQALRNLLCGARPYVSIGWLWAWGLGHMLLLCGARPYVSIGWLWAWRWVICFYYAALGRMFVLVGCALGARPYVSIMRR